MTIDIVDTQRARAFLPGYLGNIPTEAPATGHNELVAIAAVRHAASRQCPCSSRALVAAAATALDGILGEDLDLIPLLQVALDDLIGAGDLFHAAEAETGRALVYQSPPMFVRSAANTVYLVGGLPEADWALAQQATSNGPYRRVSPAPDDEELRELGVAEYPMTAWLEHPTMRQPDDLLAGLDRDLERSGPAGALGDLLILDPDRRVDFYVGRFVPPRKQTGRFVARRKRKYGADSWSYVEIVDGEPARFLDLPVLDSRFRACDEAWWVICAMDAVAGRPQELQAARADGKVALAFHMPVPRWAERRLNVFGEPTSRLPGSLFAYLLEPEDATREIAFFRRSLWFAQVGQKVGV